MELFFCPKGEFVKEFEIDFEVPKNYKSVINLHSCGSQISIFKNLN